MKLKSVTLGLLVCFAAATAQGSQSTPVAPGTNESRFAAGKAEADQARVVYYRKADRVADGVAYVYVDGEFHTALLPNSYNVFCLNPGRHFLGSWFKEPPHHLGKEAPTREFHLHAGETVFLRVDPLINGRSLDKTEKQARTESDGLKKNIHMLSRASSVIPCKSGVYKL